MTAHPQRGRMNLAQRRRLRAVTAINTDVRPSADRVSYDMLRDGLARNRWDPSVKVWLSCPVPSRYSQVLQKYMNGEQSSSEYITSVICVEDEFDMAVEHFESEFPWHESPAVPRSSMPCYHYVTIPADLDPQGRAELSRLAFRLPLRSIWRWIP